MEYFHHAKPFAFDRVFALSAVDASTGIPDLQLQLIAVQTELALTRDDRDAALMLARVDGFEAGLAQARGETATAMLAATESVGVQLQALDERFAEIEARMSSTAATVALAIGEVLAAHALAGDPLAAIDAALGRVLLQVGFREALQIHVHPALVAPLHLSIAERRSIEQRAIVLTVHADPALPLGDTRICWDQGGLSLDAAARHVAVRAELEMLLPAD